MILRALQISTALFAVLLGALTSPAAAQLRDTLPGLYACQGTNPDGSAYEGRVEIAARKGVYNLKWKVGETAYVGVALREGDVLSVAWGMPGDEETVIGVVAYRIEKGGTLVGRWTVLGSDLSVMKETLRKIPDA